MEIFRTLASDGLPACLQGEEGGGGGDRGGLSITLYSMHIHSCVFMFECFGVDVHDACMWQNNLVDVHDYYFQLLEIIQDHVEHKLTYKHTCTAYILSYMAITQSPAMMQHVVHKEKMLTLVAN